MTRDELSDKARAVYDVMCICQSAGIQNVADIPGIYRDLPESEKIQLCQMLVENTLLFRACPQD